MGTLCPLSGWRGSCVQQSTTACALQVLPLRTTVARLMLTVIIVLTGATMKFYDMLTFTAVVANYPRGVVTLPNSQGNIERYWAMHTTCRPEALRRVVGQYAHRGVTIHPDGVVDTWQGRCDLCTKGFGSGDKA